MRVRVQLCWSGHADSFVFRALIGGGLLVRSESGKWSRAVAREMLDILEAEGFERHKIRFVHV